MSPALFSQLPPPRESINAQTRPQSTRSSSHQCHQCHQRSLGSCSWEWAQGSAQPWVTARDCPSTGTAQAVKPLQARERRREELGEGPCVMQCPQHWLSQCSWDPGRGHCCPLLLAVLSPGPWAVMASGSPVPCPTWRLSCLLGLFCPPSPWLLSPDCPFVSPGSQFPQGSGIHLPCRLPCHCPPVLVSSSDTEVAEGGDRAQGYISLLHFTCLHDSLV